MTDLADEPVLEPGTDAAPAPAAALAGSEPDGDTVDAEDPAPPGIPRGARVLGAFGRVLITAGAVVFLFVAYELWGTNIREARAQDQLRDELDERFAVAAAIPDLADPLAVTVIDAGTAETAPEALPTPSSTLPGGYDPAVLDLFFPADGEALARIDLPTIGVDKVVVRGVGVADLRKGPGHYPGTPLPGNPGNTSIAGHRTTYGAPFNRVDELRPGDEIVVTGVQGEFTYRVMDPRVAYAGFESGIESIGEGHVIVEPDAVWVLAEFGDDRLTLTACHPKLSSRQRIIVAAELVSDPVALPEWATHLHAQQVAESEATLGADEDFDDPTDPAVDPSADTEPVQAAAIIDLDGGLSGERGAIPGAVAWMAGALLFWTVGGLIGRRLAKGRWVSLATRFAGLVPALICLWFAFEKIDRALPAA